MAIVSKMLRRTWQLNYKYISKQSCVSIVRETCGELPDASAARPVPSFRPVTLGQSRQEVTDQTTLRIGRSWCENAPSPSRRDSFRAAVLCRTAAQVRDCPFQSRFT